jgi:hypothetical protein
MGAEPLGISRSVYGGKMGNGRVQVYRRGRRTTGRRQPIQDPRLAATQRERKTVCLRLRASCMSDTIGFVMRGRESEVREWSR